MNRQDYKHVLERLVRMAKRYHRDVLYEQKRNEEEGGGSFHFEQFLQARAVRSTYMHAAKLLREQWRESQQKQKERRGLRRYPGLRRAA